jgi:hypothetical protein
VKADVERTNGAVKKRPSLCGRLETAVEKQQHSFTATI